MIVDSLFESKSINFLNDMSINRILRSIFSKITPRIVKKAISNNVTKLLVFPVFIDQIYFLINRHGLVSYYKKNPIPNIESKKFKSYNFILQDELKKYKKWILDEEKYEEINFPIVYGLSQGGKYSVFFDQVAIYEFANAKIFPYSDFINIDDKVYWDKFSKPQLPMIVPADSNLITYDSKKALLINHKQKISVKCGFSFLGVHINSWGHFVGNYLPKFEALKSINDPNIEILLPTNIDSHIKEISETLAHEYKCYKITYVDPCDMVYCDKLYYCTSPSFIADDASFIHPSFINIRTFSKEIIFKYSKFLKKDIVKFAKRKLFIARTTQRNIDNYIEIENLFSHMGFEIIYPNQLSLKEKITKFSEATHVTGPGSSGFVNVIFCEPETKILAFHNFSRTLDLYGDLLSDKRFFNIQLIYLTGTEASPGTPHGNYNINLDRLKSCMREINFLD